ncbi:MAG: hypothetical protein OEZ58_03010 [Gammaproteobacteria bacterium]|nr:hypothetical protein [Gammaproteobacteria bacterium]MDH5727934.1 hypothetical protein [Gammaproteobacteria bacterium]
MKAKLDIIIILASLVAGIFLSIVDNPITGSIATLGILIVWELLPQIPLFRKEKAAP